MYLADPSSVELHAGCKGTRHQLLSPDPCCIFLFALSSTDQSLQNMLQSKDKCSAGAEPFAGFGSFKVLILMLFFKCLVLLTIHSSSWGATCSSSEAQPSSSLRSVLALAAEKENPLSG